LKLKGYTSYDFTIDSIGRAVNRGACFGVELGKSREGPLHENGGLIFTRVKWPSSI